MYNADRHRVISIFIVAMLISLLPFSGHAQQDSTVAPNVPAEKKDLAGFDETVHYFGKDSTIFDLANDWIYLFGDGSFVQYKDIELKAARIRFSIKEKTVYAGGIKDSTGNWIGRPLFKDATNSFENDSLGFNFDTKRGISYGSRTQEGEAFLIAQVSKRQTNEKIHIRNGMLTTCDKPNPHFHFHLTKAVVIPNEKVVTGPFYMKIRKVPVPLALPFGFFPNKKESTAGILLPGYGNGGDRGFFLQNLGFYYPISQHLDTRVMVDLYTRGSWSVRNITNYKKRYRYSGNLNISKTLNKVGLEELPTYFQQHTFNVRWTHFQDAKARPDQTFSANVNLGSSQNFRNNLNASQQDYLTGTFNSSLQWSKSFPGKPFSLTLTANHTQNTQTQVMQVTFPSATFNVQRINLLKNIFPKSPIGISGTINAESLYSGKESDFNLNNITPLIKKASHGIRYNTSASTSWKLGAYATINPAANFTLFQAFQTLAPVFDEETGVTQLDTLNQMLWGNNWNTSITANSRIYGNWVLRKPGYFKAFRHVIQPNVGLSYAPKNNFSLNGPYGEDGAFVGYTAFDAARFRPSNTRESANINLSINQNIEAKVRESKGGKISYKKVKIIEGFKTSASYNTIADSLNWSNLQWSAFTTIGQNITLNYNSTHSLYDRDSLGREVNQFLWNTQNRFTRLEGANLALGFNMRGDGSKKQTDQLNSNTNAANLFTNNTAASLSNNGQQIDFSTPWSLNMKYNLRYAKMWDKTAQRDSSQWVQAVTVVGDITILKKWAISINSGYDFKMDEFTPSIIGLHWDLHCWEFSFNAVPFGDRKSYFAQLNVKASILQDLKLQRRGSLGTDQNYWE